MSLPFQLFNEVPPGWSQWKLWVLFHETFNAPFTQNSHFPWRPATKGYVPRFIYLRLIFFILVRFSLHSKSSRVKSTLSAPAWPTGFFSLQFMRPECGKKTFHGERLLRRLDTLRGHICRVLSKHDVKRWCVTVPKFAIGPLHDPVTWYKITCRWASCPMGLPKQCNSYQFNWTCLCFGRFAAQRAHQHVWFCTMWPDRAKGLLANQKPWLLSWYSAIPSHWPDMATRSWSLNSTFLVRINGMSGSCNLTICIYVSLNANHGSTELLCPRSVPERYHSV